MERRPMRSGNILSLTLAALCLAATLWAFQAHREATGERVYMVYEPAAAATSR